MDSSVDSNYVDLENNGSLVPAVLSAGLNLYMNIASLCKG